MKITEIRAIGLRGATPEGGWMADLDLVFCVHTLVEVITDEGITGIGSVYTSDALVEASLDVLRRHYIGERFDVGHLLDRSAPHALGRDSDTSAPPSELVINDIDIDGPDVSGR